MNKVNVFNIPEQRLTYGDISPSYIYSFNVIQLYLISHHRKPLPSNVNLWQSLDRDTWFSYAYSTLCLVIIVILFGPALEIFRKVEVTEVIIRMAFGWIEPYKISWYKGYKSIKIIVVVWLFIGISFNWLYNVEFRSSLIAQIFPKDIDDFDQVDILGNGFFISSAYQGNSITIPGVII